MRHTLHFCNKMQRMKSMSNWHTSMNGMSTSNIGEDDTYLRDLLMIRIVYIFVNVNLLIILSLVNYPKGYFK